MRAMSSMFSKIPRWAPAALGAGLTVWLWAPDPVRADWYSDRQDKMGTRIEVQIWHDDSAEAERLLAAAMAEVERIDHNMSTYIADSELSQLNARAASEPVVISSELFDLLQVALSLSETTGGAFDVTYDSVGYLYDFREHVRPSPESIAELLGAVDYRHVVLEAERSSVSFTQAGVRINLGGIAKGHTVERVIGLLREQGIERALASAGGDTRILGDRSGYPWVVGIRDPDDEGSVATRLAVVDEAISTSGDYERYFIEDGHRYHHILNPASGTPVTGIRSVTVIGPEATMTDGLSTSVFVLGRQRGLELIESLPDYETVIIESGGRLVYSSGLDPR